MNTEGARAPAEQSARAVSPPIRHKYRDGDEVTIDDLREAVITAAEAVAIDSKFLPIFERLEGELRAREGKNDALDRVKKMAEISIQIR